MGRADRDQVGTQRLARTFFMSQTALDVQSVDDGGDLLGQSLLFSPEIENELQREEEKGNYTAERLKVQRPDIYKAIIKLRNDGYGLLAIRDTLAVHNMTVAAVLAENPESIDIGRRRLVDQVRHAGRLQVERMIEHPNCVPFNVAGLVAKQLLELGEVMDGRASHRTEHVERIDIYSDWDQVLAGLPTEKQVHEIGSSAGENDAIEARLEAGEAGDPRPSTDVLSLAAPPIAQVIQQIDTDCATESGQGDQRSEGPGTAPVSQDLDRRGGDPDGLECQDGKIDTATPKFLGNTLSDSNP